MADDMSTPINTITRDNLTVLIRNNIILNNSLDFNSDCDMMESDSPVRKPTSLQPICKKLFHSPMATNHNEYSLMSHVERSKKARKRKRSLIPDSGETIKKVYIKECDREGYSPDLKGGMRKKILISLFHNKEYSMDFS